MELTDNFLKELKNSWENSQKEKVLLIFSKIERELVQLKSLSTYQHFHWIEFISTSLVSAKNFILAEKFLKTFLERDDINIISPEKRALINNRLGVTYGFRGIFHKAIQCYREVYDIGTAYKRANLVVRACNNLGLNFMHLENITESENILKEGLAKLKSIKNKEERNQLEIIIRGNYGELLRRKHQYYHSIKEIEIVLKLLAQKSLLTIDELLEVTAETLKTKFLSNFALNNYEEIENSMDTLNSLVFTPNSHFGVYYYFVIHGLYRWLINKKLDLAEQFFQLALSIALKIDAGEFIYQVQILMAQLLLEKIQREEKSKIQKYSNDFINLLTDITSFSQNQQLYGILAETRLLQTEYYRSVGNFKIAYQNLSIGNVLISQYNLDHLIPRYDQIEKRLQESIDERENEGIISLNISSFEGLAQYLTEIHKIVKIYK